MRIEFLVAPAAPASSSPQTTGGTLPRVEDLALEVRLAFAVSHVHDPVAEALQIIEFDGAAAANGSTKTQNQRDPEGQTGVKLMCHRQLFWARDDSPHRTFCHLTRPHPDLDSTFIFGLAAVNHKLPAPYGSSYRIRPAKFSASGRTGKNYFNCKRSNIVS